MEKKKVWLCLECAMALMDRNGISRIMARDKDGCVVEFDRFWTGETIDPVGKDFFVAGTVSEGVFHFDPAPFSGPASIAVNGHEVVDDFEEARKRCALDNDEVRIILSGGEIMETISDYLLNVTGEEPHEITHMEIDAYAQEMRDRVRGDEFTMACLDEALAVRNSDGPRPS